MLNHFAMPSESSVSTGVDLTNCDREPVHLARAIQPHGCLLVVNEADFSISQASANTACHLGIPCAALLNRPLSTLLAPADMATLQYRLHDKTLDSARVYLMVITPLPGLVDRVHVLGHRADGRLLLEFEPAGAAFSSGEVHYLSILSNTLRELRNAQSLSIFLEAGLRWLAGFTGYDRVMAYRFAGDGTGQVIAEVKRDGLEPFLGLHYPASDIPVPARRLFNYSPLRHLPDTEYVPVPLMEAAGQPVGIPLDMSYLLLRSVSTLYTGYLRNMGVRSALVMPLMTHHNEIWGLISCLNHTEPLHLSCERRAPVEYLTQSLSLMIHDRREREHHDYQTRLDAVLDGLVKNLSQCEDLHQTLCSDAPNLLSELAADGAALVYGGRLSRMGITPDPATLATITDWLTLQESDIIATHTLRRDCPGLPPTGLATCGVLSVRLRRSQPDWLLWFRNETPREIDWAGNPEKPVEIDSRQPEARLMPRTSFARWRQTVTGESALWQAVEIDYAVRLRQVILGIIVERARRLEQLNAELLAAMAENLRILEQLNRYSERLAEAQQRARLGYWDFSLETAHFTASDQLCHLFGVEPGSLDGPPKRILSRLDPDDAHRLMAHLQTTTDRQTFRLDIHITRTDGIPRILDTLGEVIHADAGATTRISGSSQDVTEHRTVQQQMEKLALAVEQSPESIMITDLSGRIEYVNQAFIRHSGYTAAEALGQNPRILNGGITSRETYHELWQTLLRGKVWEGEFVNRRKSGGLYTQRAKVTPLRRPDGRITHYIAVQEDITEQKRMARELEAYRNELEERVSQRTEELHRQSRFLRALIDHLPHLVWLKDTNGQILAANRALALSHRKPSASLTGLQDTDLVSAAMAARYRADETRVMLGRTPLTREESLEQIPDSLYETYLAPVVDEQDRVLGTVGFARDIKPQRHMETELARRVLEAEAATRAKSAFLANMSHEIRTPLTAIIGFAEGLLETVQTREEHDQAIRTIIRNGRHLQELIANILDFSKIEAEQIKVESARIALLPLLADVNALAVSLARGRQLAFSYHLMPPLPSSLWSDATRIKQILINLIGNAVKFTPPPGAVRLIVSLDQAAGQLVLTIQDTGIGIDPAELRRLFQPFAQADASITRRFGGTGLGLSISRELARQLGGDIRVLSLRNVGSCFVVTLATGPLAEVSLIEAAVDLTMPDADGGGHPVVPRLRGRILVAEDTPDNQKLITLLIRRTGAEAVIACNGQEALDKAQTAEFDLVLMDMQMPVMDGLEAVELLRLTGFPHPVIMLTANATEEDQQNAEQVGCSGFLTKPIDQAAFYRLLAQCLPPPDPTDETTVSPVSVSLEQDPEYCRLRTAFLEELPARLDELEVVLANRDWPTLQRRLHQLKGIAGSFGFPHISATAQGMETVLKNGDEREVARIGQTLFRLMRDAG